jgi:hypothetical protein
MAYEDLTIVRSIAAMCGGGPSEKAGIDLGYSSESRPKVGGFGSAFGFLVAGI